MQDFIINLVLICVMASPILYFRIGKKKIAYLTEKNKEEKAKKEPLWDVPNHIAAPILIMASILDIVIILPLGR